MADDQHADHAHGIRRIGDAIWQALCWLGARLSYATAAMLLVDVMAWDKDGKIVRNYLNNGSDPGADA
ncbi:hypothetical protein PO002_25290 [Cupriavidus necator]|uniref:hypothetical protein n=1 Tax=Cupriavidus necator TaxID=106590 RepID=UPI0039C479AE